MESSPTVVHPSFFLCFIPILLISGWVLLFHLLDQRNFRQFLRQHEGVEFFCYTNRKNSYSFVEEEILPYLDPDIKIIHLEGRTPISQYNEQYISRILHNLKQIGFPNVMKINSGKVMDLSLHHELYETINQRKPASHFLRILDERIQELRKG